MPAPHVFPVLTRALQGGCLCGRVCYAIAARDGAGRPAVVDAGFCHCRSCQRASGAPVLAWATVRRGAWRWLAGQVAVYASSAAGRRGFCPHCGTALTFSRSDQPDTLDVTLASLDEHAALTPAYHIWMSQSLPGLHWADALPRYWHDENGPRQESAGPAPLPPSSID